MDEYRRTNPAYSGRLLVDSLVNRRYTSLIEGYRLPSEQEPVEDRLRNLAERMARLTDMEVEGKPALEEGRQLALDLPPHRLAFLPSSMQWVCYLFGVTINGIWRNFGGDSTIGMPVRSDHPLAGSMLCLINSLGNFVNYALPEADTVRAISYYEKTVSTYVSLLQEGEALLASRGGTHA